MNKLLLAAKPPNKIMTISISAKSGIFLTEKNFLFSTLFHVPLRPLRTLDWIALERDTGFLSSRLRSGRKSTKASTQPHVGPTSSIHHRFSVSLKFITVDLLTGSQKQVQILAGLPNLFVLPKYINAKLCSR